MICQRVDRASVAIDGAHARVADRLVDARLVTSDEESFQLAHEAVAREWPRLREWLADDVEGQRIMRHLNAAANAWEAMGRPDSELYRGPRLSAATHWRESASPVLATVEAAFLDASVEREAADIDATRRQLAQERRSVRRLRWLAGATASLAVLALAAGPSRLCRSVRRTSRRSSMMRVGSQRSPVRSLCTSARCSWRWKASGSGMRRRRDGPPGCDGPQPSDRGCDANERRRGYPADVARARQLDGRHRGRAIRSPESSTSTSVSQVGLDSALRARVRRARRRRSAGRTDCAQRAGRIRASQNGSCDDSALRAHGPRRPKTRRDDLHRVPRRCHRHRVLAGPIVCSGHRAAPLGGRTGNVAIWRVDAPDAPMLLDLPHAGANPGAPNWANAFGRVRFSPDGSRLYASGFGPTAIFDTRTGELVGELEGDGILAVSPDGGSYWSGKVARRCGSSTSTDRDETARAGDARGRHRRCFQSRTGRTSPRPAATRSGSGRRSTGQAPGGARRACRHRQIRGVPLERGTGVRGRGRRSDHLGDGRLDGAVP